MMDPYPLTRSPRNPGWAPPLRARLAVLACLLALGTAAVCEAGTTVRGRISVPVAEKENAAQPPASAPDLREAVIYVTQWTGVKGKKLKRKRTRENVKLTIDRFTPTVTPIVAESRIRFENVDRVYHKVFSVSPARRFDLGVLRPGQTAEVKFDSLGVVQLYCELHP